MTTWKTGDTVKLKSGGPRMTVRGMDMLRVGYAMCDWFEGVTPRSGEYLPDQLIADNPTAPAQRRPMGVIR